MCFWVSQMLGLIVKMGYYRSLNTSMRSFCLGLKTKTKIDSFCFAVWAFKIWVQLSSPLLWL